MSTKKKISIFLLLFAFVLTLGGEVILSAFSLRASADTVSYSNVLDDLKKDSTFNPEDYPAISGSNEIRVIQIAESEDGQLYLYTYQPGNNSKHYKANYINMALESNSNRDLKYSLYSLTWLSRSGVFDKYVINDFSVLSDEYRYYNISAIYRPYDSKVDLSSEAIDNVQCKSFTVGQYWCAYYYNNKIIYEMETVDYVDIDIQATGSVRYTEGFKLYDDYCDSHYVAFSIGNYNVDKIYDADIAFTLTDYLYTLDLSSGIGHTVIEGSENVPSKKLSEFDKGSNDGDGLLGKKYTWNRITDVDTFIKEVENDTNDYFSSEELSGLAKSQFVFRFLETDYEKTTSLGSHSVRYTSVTSIGVLRLHFLSEGKVYNLGCVSDLVGTDSDPELSVSVSDNVKNEEWWQILAILLVVILIFVVIQFFGKPIEIFLSIIWTGIKTVFNIITLPFRLIWQLLFKRSG